MAGAAGPNLGVVYGYSPGDVGWGVTGYNPSMARLDTLTHLAVKDTTLATPPGSPTTGDRYIIAASPTGAWSGQVGKVTVWNGSAWVFYTPKAGWRTFDENSGGFFYHLGTVWVAESSSSLTAGAHKLLGNPGTATAAPSDITVGTGLTLSSGGTLSPDGLAFLAGPTFTGTVSTAGGVLHVASPSGTADATTKGYVDTADALLAPKASPTLTGTANIGNVVGTGVWDLTGGTVSVPAPTSGAHPATRDYVDSARLGLQTKPSAKVATNAALAAYTYANGTAGAGATITFTSTGTNTVDGYVTAAGDTVLVKDETSANGLYLVTVAGAGGVAGVWTRHHSMDETGDFEGASIVVESEGTANPNTFWVCSDILPTVGTTTITFNHIKAPGTYVQGTGIVISGTTVSADSSVVAFKASPTLTGTAHVAGLVGTSGTWDLTGLTSVLGVDPPSPTDNSQAYVTSSWLAAYLAASGYAPIGGGAVASVVGSSGTVTLANLVAGGVAKTASPTFTGTIDATGAVLHIASPSGTADATTKNYVDTADALLAPKASPTFTGTINATGAVLHVATPSGPTDAVTKAYVDAIPAAGTINAGYVIANTGTASAVGSGVAVSSLIDTIGSVQGDILQRNGSVWAVLAPGTAGQVLKSGGAAANNSWGDPLWSGSTITSIGNGVFNVGGALSVRNRGTVTATTTGTISPTGIDSCLVNIGTTNATLTVSGGFIGQPLRLEILQGATAHTVAFDATVVFGADVTSFTASATASKRDLVELIANTTSTWMFIGYSRGFA